MRSLHVLCCFAVTGLLLLAAGRVNSAEAATYTIKGDTAGAVRYYTVTKEDTLFSIARYFDVGIVELMTANPGVDPWVPKQGTVLMLPTAYVLPTIARKGIVIDLSGLRLFYFPDAHTVMTFPLGIGMDGWSTPVGSTRIILKREHPTWIAPESILKANPNLPHVVPPGPDNPLGDYAMNLGWEGYRIHGTNKPYGIGRRSSHGCMRMYPEDIDVLFHAVKVGTPVTVIDDAYKLGWLENTLYLQVSPSQQQADEISMKNPITLVGLPQVYGDIRQATESASSVDWRAVNEVVRWRTGIPVAIATRTVK